MVLLGAFCVEPVVLLLAKGQLQKIFFDSTINIGDCRVALFHRVSFSDIAIKKEPLYDFMIGEARISYTPASLLKGAIEQVTLSDASITIRLAGKSIQEIQKHFSLGISKNSAVLTFNTLTLSNCKFTIAAQELTTNATISLAFDLAHRKLEGYDCAIDSLASSGLQLNKCLLSVSRNNPSGVLTVETLSYQNATLRAIKASLRLEDTMVVFDSLSAQVFEGMLRAHGRLSLDPELRYEAYAEFEQLDLGTFVKDFKLSDKIELQGKLSGAITVKGKGASFQIIDGNLSTSEEGGTMTIKDDAYLKNLAARTNQSLDIIVDSFKNYHYNTGMAKLFLNNADLIFDIRLDGEAGKRDLALTLHEFILTKGEK